LGGDLRREGSSAAAEIDNPLTRDRAERVDQVFAVLGHIGE